MENIFKLSKFEQVLVQIILVFWAIIVIAPIYIAVNNSFKESAAYVDEAPFAFPPRAANGRLVFTDAAPGEVVPEGTEFNIEGKDFPYVSIKEATVLDSGRLTVRIEASVKGREGELKASLVNDIENIQSVGSIQAGRIMFKVIDPDADTLPVIPAGTEINVEVKDYPYVVTRDAKANKTGDIVVQVKAADPSIVDQQKGISIKASFVNAIPGIPAEGLVNPRGGVINGLEWSPSSYASAWTDGQFGDLFLNSVLISLSSVLIVVVLSTMCGFVLARMPFKGSNIILLCFLVGMMIPLRLAMAPLLQVVNQLGLYDTRIAVILVISAMSMPMSVFILSSFFKQVSPELEQAARMDGATPFQIYCKVVIPMVKPAVASVALISFVWAWNEYFFPLILLTSPEKAPITLGMQNFNSEFGRQWHLVFAAIIIMVLPTIVAFLLASKQFIAGLAAGGVKE